ncbi:protein translocase subunit SecF [Candidatus Woesearchaeota archaeon]|nr:protein translocase subunit SecF [Candidatus Woesearchaeota archaeon]
MLAQIKHIYEHKYKLLMILPILLVVLALLQIGSQTITTGDFIHRGVSLKGGSTITLNQVEGLNPDELGSFLKGKFPGRDIEVRTLTTAGTITAIAIDTDAQQAAEIDAITKVLKEKVGLEKVQYSVEVMGASLGESFFRQAGLALLFSFLLMGIVVILYFRVWIPSLAVIAAAFSDIVVTIAIFNLTGMKLSTAGVAAFLMLIGYSIDTDILLTSRVLKRKEGTVMDRIYGAINTGLTMTFTTLAAVLVALFLVQSEAIRQIMFIIFIGLIIDMIMTWIQNVGFIRLYLEHKEKKLQHKVN